MNLDINTIINLYSNKLSESEKVNVLLQTQLLQISEEMKALKEEIKALKEENEKLKNDDVEE